MSVLNFLKDEYIKRKLQSARNTIQKYDPKILEHQDEIHIRGRVMMGYGKHYEWIKDIYGNMVRKCVLDDVVWDAPNLIILPGNQYAFCKLFNLPITVTGGNVMTPISNVTPGFLNDPNQMNFDNKLPTPNELVGVNIHPLHFVNGFTIGYGGATESNIVARDVNYKTRMLYQPVPFRYTGASINTQTLTRYGGKVTSAERSGGQNIVSYYVKKFDSDPTAQIYHLWKDNGLNDGTPCTNSIFDTMEDNGMDVESYAEAELSVEPLEVREYFQSVLSGEPPRINELGLVAAYWDPASMDTFQVQQISHICFPTESLHGIGSSVGAKALYLLYRIYLK